MLSWKTVHELVFKHLEQLVQRTEPAEPLITVIYKLDSTLMGRQSLPSPSFIHFSSLPLFIPNWLLTAVHLLSNLPSSISSPTLFLSFSFPLLLPLSRFQPHNHICYHISLSALLSCQITKWEGREVSWADKFPHEQRKNVFLPFCKTSQYSLRSGLGPHSSLGMHETKQQTKQPLRQAWTFLGDCLACRYACKSVTEWEQWHQMDSQALEPAVRLQQMHYSQALAHFVCPTGSTFGSRKSAGVSLNAGGNGDVYVRGSVEGWVNDQQNMHRILKQDKKHITSKESCSSAQKNVWHRQKKQH